VTAVSHYFAVLHLGHYKCHYKMGNPCYHHSLKRHLNEIVLQVAPSLQFFLRKSFMHFSFFPCMLRARPFHPSLGHLIIFGYEVPIYTRTNMPLRILLRSFKFLRFRLAHVVSFRWSLVLLCVLRSTILTEVSL
jgi:hypothetical protein